MIDRKELKRRARLQLGGGIFTNKWLMALVVCMIYSAVSAVVNTPSLIGSFSQMGQMVQGFDSGDFSVSVNTFSPLSGIGSIALIILSGPFTYGLNKMFLKQARDGQDMKIEDVFLGFKEDIGGNIVLALLIGLFTFLWTLLFIIPGIVMALGYSMAFYIKADHPDYDWKMCINESKRIMKGNKGRLFVLQLSFIGWYIVGALCLGIGTFWVVPYQAAAEAHFYQVIAYPTIGYNDSEAMAGFEGAVEFADATDYSGDFDPES